MTAILGISAFYHDSAAALIVDGKIVAAAQEERFSRIRHDPAFPAAAIDYCLETAGLSLEQLSAVVFYDKPLLKFERLLETSLLAAPRGILAYLAAMPQWIKEKLYTKVVLRRQLCQLGGLTRDRLPRLLFSSHHMAHAAAAFYPSAYQRAAILCVDGVGEWATTSLWLGVDNQITPLWELRFPHSLGLLYTAFTTYLGFNANSGEYKMMGLAPYGQPRYRELILEKLIDVAADGTFRLNMKYFAFTTGLAMTNARFQQLFGAPPREPESAIEQRHMDIARSIQSVTEMILLRLAHQIFAETGERNLCLAGGVALNCVANGRLLREGPFDNIWVQPASGDAGSALGAALAAWHQYFAQPRSGEEPARDRMQGAQLGPQFSQQQVVDWLEQAAIPYRLLDQESLYRTTAGELADGKVVGWFQGRMEFGPRALGNRSILATPLLATMSQHLNHKIKYRESFRPFAPVVMAERAAEYFQLDRDLPYMQFTAPVISSLPLPAVTHVDQSARIQTVDQSQNPPLYRLLQQFEQVSGCAVLINTSFNRRGEPIVCTPQEAYRCFSDSEMDCLVLGNCLITDKPQSLSALPDKAATAPLTRWKRGALALGRINNRLILGLIYLLLFIPTGLILQLVRAGKPQVRRGTSYRIDLPDKPTPQQMEKPF